MYPLKFEDILRPMIWGKNQPIQTVAKFTPVSVKVGKFHKWRSYIGRLRGEDKGKRDCRVD